MSDEVVERVQEVRTYFVPDPDHPSPDFRQIVVNLLEEAAPWLTEPDLIQQEDGALCLTLGSEEHQKHQFHLAFTGMKKPDELKGITSPDLEQDGLPRIVAVTYEVGDGPDSCLHDS